MSAIQPDLRREPLKYRLKAFFSKPANLILLIFLLQLLLLEHHLSQAMANFFRDTALSFMYRLL